MAILMPEKLGNLQDHAYPDFFGMSYPEIASHP